MKQKVVVLGGAGFIGSQIVKGFHADSFFDCCSYSSADVNLVDIENASDFLSRKIDKSVLIYCAGKHRQYSDSFQTMLDNVSMVNSLIEASRINKPRHIVFLSSVEIYGVAGKTPLTETSIPCPMNRYGIGKIACENLLELFCHEEQIPLSILRLPGIFGATDQNTSIISKLVTACKTKQTFKVMGGGKDLRDFVYVKDLVNLVLLISRSEGIGTLNVATGKSYSLLEVIDIVSAHYGHCPTELIESVPGTKHFDLVFDITKVKNIFPQFNFSNLDESLKDYGVTSDGN